MSSAMKQYCRVYLSNTSLFTLLEHIKQH